jgi:iron-sulfur cluster repair protein YtfE (RIC family)
MKATKLLKNQHREVKDLFTRVQETDDPYGREALLAEIGEKLAMHMAIEELIFYPAVKEAIDSEKIQEMIPEAYEEHHVIKLVLAELPQVNPEDERFEAKMTVLQELIEHHVKEEERHLFKAADALGSERLTELTAQIKELANERRQTPVGSFEDADAGLDDAEPITR